MTYTIKNAEYWCNGGATNDEIDERTVKDGVEKVHIWVYRLWARLLGDWRTACKKHGRFDSHDDLKWYLGDVTKVKVVDDDTPSDAI